MSEKLKQEIEKSVALLKQGKILLYPTDTIWGIGCDATNTKAVEKVFRLKDRHKHKSMIVLLDSADKLSLYVDKVPQIAYDLIENAASPITIVYSNAKNLSKKLIASDGSIAIRVVKDDYCLEVIKKLGHPLVSTSANISDEPAPQTFNQIADIIKERVDYVVDIHRSRIRNIRPSTIIKLEETGTFSILRL
ncbi:MAG TPA: threonylcarbamoyl-AMP synthase [Bacteroidetes bacterium]|nr:threonylcarbamoyl-AMP synthase [Bacteroidota bacterium]